MDAMDGIDTMDRGEETGGGVEMDKVGALA
jgi:hypothetical protein